MFSSFASRGQRLTAVCCSLVVAMTTGMFSSNSIQAASQTDPFLRVASATSAISTGVDLELDRKWLSAIEHYKEALKQWPDSDQLRFGLRRSKIHFSIERRYLDGSFEQDMLSLEPRSALAEWDDVYEMISSRYVERIDVTSFVAHGTESLYLALANDHFLAHHGLDRDDAAVRALRRFLREQYWNKPLGSKNDAHQVMKDISNLCQRRLSLAPTAVILEYVFGGTNVLDDYSMVLTPEKLKALYANIDGEFVGLGIEMKAEEGKGMLLVNVLPQSPAEQGGAQPGDYIVGISGQDCRNWTTEEAAKLLKGPEESQVQLMLANQQGDVRGPITFVRRPVSVKSIPVVKMIDDEHKIGYLKMTAFQKSSAQELDAALRELNAQGMESLIWDLRGNPGGLLTAAVEVLDRFLEGGTIVSTRGRHRGEDWSYSAHRSGTWDMPLVVLIDNNSASASEIAAGAIFDHRRGLLVGRQSYGKWSVQSIFNADNSTGIRLTTAKFFSPHGKNYSHVGIKPNVEVAEKDEMTTYYRGPETLNPREDSDIAKATEILQSQNQYWALTRHEAQLTP
ncbi:MAG: S41 family peptidase [Planctomycetaceae bacterium]|nr:S41 family peptidase [Planctomycetaceae bacterium]